MWQQRFHYCSKHGKACGGDLWDYFEQSDFPSSERYTNVVISLTEEEFNLIENGHINEIYT